MSVKSGNTCREGRKGSATRHRITRSIGKSEKEMKTQAGPDSIVAEVWRIVESSAGQWII